MKVASRTFASRVLLSAAACAGALASVYACTSSGSTPGLSVDAGSYSVTNCPNGGVLASACAACITTSCAPQVSSIDTACASALACACPTGVDAASCAISTGCTSAIQSAASQCTTCESACGVVTVGTDAGHPGDGGGPDATSTDSGSPLDATPAPADAYVTYDAGLPPSLVQAPHLQLWLRADTGITSSGATEPYPVSIWQDLSGNGRNATQPAAANQPQLHTTTPLTGTTSSLPWVQFVPGTGDGNGDDAGSNSFFMNVDLSFLANSAYTIVVVASRYSDKSENYFLGTHFGGAGTNTALHVGWSDDTDYYLGQFGNDLSATVDANAPTGWQPTLATAKLDTDAGHFIYLSGTQAANDTDTSPLTIADTGILGRGYASTPDNTYFAGGVGELIVYDVALSDADRQAIEAYLQSRWQP